MFPNVFQSKLDSFHKIACFFCSRYQEPKEIDNRNSEIAKRIFFETNDPNAALHALCDWDKIHRAPFEVLSQEDQITDESYKKALLTFPIHQSIIF